MPLPATPMKLWSAFDRVLGDRLVFDRMELEATLDAALRRWFTDRVFYVQSASNPADLRAIRLGQFASEMAQALLVKAKPLRATLPECVDDAAIERAQEVLAQFDTLTPFTVREALHALCGSCSARPRSGWHNRARRRYRRSDGAVDPAGPVAAPTGQGQAGELNLSPAPCRSRVCRWI